MAKIKVMLYGRQSTIDGAYTVYLRVHKDGKRKFMALGCSVRKEHWDKKSSSVKNTHPSYKRLNNLIAKKYSDAMNETLDAETKDFHATTSQIVAKIKGVNSDYFKFAESYLEKFNNADQMGTYLGHRAALNILKEYAGDRLSFNEITATYLREYEMHLKKEGREVNTVGNHLKKIRSIYRAAVNEGQAEDSKNPFRTVKIPKARTKKETLSLEELRAVVESRPKVWSGMWHAKQVFLLQFYVRGVRVSDILTMEEKHVLNGRYKKSTRKTDDNVSVTLTSEAKIILDTYRREKAKRKIISPYLLPLVKAGDQSLYRRIGNANAYINNELRDLMELCGISKHISTHCARHTYASIAKSKIKDIHTLKELFGHSSLSVTQSYLADLDSAQMDEANAIVTNI